MTPRRCDLNSGVGASGADFREGFAPAPGLTTAGRQATVTPPQWWVYLFEQGCSIIARGTDGCMRSSRAPPPHRARIEASGRDITRCYVRRTVPWWARIFSDILHMTALRYKTGYILTRLLFVASHLRPGTCLPGYCTLT